MHRIRRSPAAVFCFFALCAASSAPGARAASRTGYLDPHTMLYQTDDGAEGRALAGEPGWWPLSNGLVDPLDTKDPAPRVIYSVFRISDTPFPGYDPGAPSPVFKVDQVGYMPDAPKYAYMGAWLGPRFGAWKPHGAPGAWKVVDSQTGKTVYAAPEPPLHRVDDAPSKDGVPYTGECTYEMDFSCVTNEGVYHVRVDGVGRSMDFRIWRGAAEDAFRVHMGGLYQKRCGIEKTEPYTHWTAGACHRSVTRGTFPPEEGRIPKGVRWFDIIEQNTQWGKAGKIEVSGGWHDAADYDRRPAHLGIVNDLCAAYLMDPEKFSDGQLAIPENANGIPDILDEAEWGLRHILQCQRADGGAGTWIETTGHPGPGSDAARDTMRYAVSRPTRSSTLAYAAHASLLARCRPEFAAKYLESAKKAWDFAVRTPPSHETFFVEKKKKWIGSDKFTIDWEEPRQLPVRHLVKAAINLHALTKDRRYIDRLYIMRRELRDEARKNSWNWDAWTFAGEIALGGIPPAAQTVIDEWRRKFANISADMLAQSEGAYAYRCPWWFPGKGWSHAMGWGQCHPLRRAKTLAMAHRLTGDKRYLDAAWAAFNFHNGCNPCGMAMTSGLGKKYPVAFLDLPSYVDGIAEYVPGITPYRWTYATPAKAVEKVYGGDRDFAAKCPVWRRWGNLESKTVAASEYTVHETIAPAAAVCAYLLSPTHTPPPVRPAPAQNLRDLPGYWPLP